MKFTFLGALLLLVPLIVLADSTKPKKDAPIQASTLAKAYDKDPAAADKLYKGKKIVLSGTVKVEARSGAIGLEVPDDLEHIGGIGCVFGNAGPLGKLKQGDHVTISGTVNGKDAITIILVGCTLESSDPQR